MTAPIAPDLDRLIGQAARGVLPSSVKRECGEILGTLKGSAAKAMVRTLIDRATEHKRRSQFGRFCGALLVGTGALGNTFIGALNDRRVLIGDARSTAYAAALTSLSNRLAGVDDGAFIALQERINTFLAFDHMRSAAMAGFADAVPALKERPFKYGKTLLAIANLAFLRHHFSFSGGEDLARVYARLTTPEEVASAVSAVIALANESAPLESADFAFPMPGLDTSPRFVRLLEYGRVTSKLADVEKLISVLGYQLRLVSDRPHRAVFKLGPPEPDIEYHLSLGFIRGEIGTTSADLHVAGDRVVQPYSVLAAADRLIQMLGNKLFEIKDADTPYRRLRTIIPTIPPMFEQISGWRFYEDLLLQERLAQELELPLRLREKETLQLTPSLTLQTFERAWRILSFLSLVDISLLRRHQDDEALFRNSLIRVISRDNWVDLVKAFGLSDTEVRTFLDLVSANVNRLGYLDIQYRPFLTINPTTLQVSGEEKTTPVEIVSAPAVVALANIIPNVQRAHTIRLASNAEAFVLIVAETLRGLFEQVKTNASVKDRTRRTDVDILALGTDTLYLFECKHSITPTGAHELRDLWKDIHKGVSQLETGIDILRSRLPDYLAGWFPGADRRRARGLRLQPCVLCSHRVFSGLTIRGIPIRDHASLGLVLGDATVRMGRRNEGNEVTLTRYRLRQSDEATVADLDNYLGAAPLFFKTFEPFMTQFTAVDRLADRVTLAEDSYVFQISEGLWAEHLEAIGAVRLSDETLTVGPAEPPVDA